MTLPMLYKFARPLLHRFDARSIYTSARRLALTTFKLSDIGEGINEVQLVKWEKNVGDEVEEMEAVCTVQSDKAAVEITSRFTGTVKKLYVKEGETLKIGSPLMDIDTVDEVPEPTDTNVPSSVAGGQKRSFSVLATPKTVTFSSRRYTAQLPPTRPGTRPLATAKAEPDEDVRCSHVQVVTVKLDVIGAAMVKSMVASLEVPHVTVGEEVDLTALTALYRSYRESPPPDAGPQKITITPFIIKCLSLALEKVPIMNSKFNGDSYLLFRQHNISVAINSRHGLMVPNIKGVNRLSIREIQRELAGLVERANSRTLTLSDIRGGTVALSNLGPLGGTFVNARLFDGQATIVAVGRAIPRVVPVPAGDRRGSTCLDDYRLECRSLCSIGVTSDHRHIDGATIATFISHFKAFLHDAEALRRHL